MRADGKRGRRVRRRWFYGWQVHRRLILSGDQSVGKEGKFVREPVPWQRMGGEPRGGIQGTNGEGTYGTKTQGGWGAQNVCGSTNAFIDGDREEGRGVWRHTEHIRLGAPRAMLLSGAKQIGAAVGAPALRGWTKGRREEGGRQRDGSSVARVGVGLGIGREGTVRGNNNRGGGAGVGASWGREHEATQGKRACLRGLGVGRCMVGVWQGWIGCVVWTSACIILCTGAGVGKSGSRGIRAKEG